MTLLKDTKKCPKTSPKKKSLSPKKVVKNPSKSGKVSSPKKVKSPTPLNVTKKATKGVCSSPKKKTDNVMKVKNKIKLNVENKKGAIKIKKNIKTSPQRTSPKIKSKNKTQENKKPKTAQQNRNVKKINNSVCTDVKLNKSISVKDKANKKLDKPLKKTLSCSARKNSKASCSQSTRKKAGEFSGERKKDVKIKEEIDFETPLAVDNVNLSKKKAGKMSQSTGRRTSQRLLSDTTCSEISNVDSGISRTCSIKEEIENEILNPAAVTNTLNLPSESKIISSTLDSANHVTVIHSPASTPRREGAIYTRDAKHLFEDSRSVSSRDDDVMFMNETIPTPLISHPCIPPSPIPGFSSSDNNMVLIPQKLLLSLTQQIERYNMKKRKKKMRLNNEIIDLSEDDKSGGSTPVCNSIQPSLFHNKSLTPFQETVESSNLSASTDLSNLSLRNKQVSDDVSESDNTHINYYFQTMDKPVDVDPEVVSISSSEDDEDEVIQINDVLPLSKESSLDFNTPTSSKVQEKTNLPLLPTYASERNQILPESTGSTDSHHSKSLEISSLNNKEDDCLSLMTAMDEFINNCSFTDKNNESTASIEINAEKETCSNKVVQPIVVNDNHCSSSTRTLRSHRKTNEPNIEIPELNRKPSKDSASSVCESCFGENRKAKIKKSRSNSQVFCSCIKAEVKEELLLEADEANSETVSPVLSNLALNVKNENLDNFVILPNNQDSSICNIKSLKVNPVLTPVKDKSTRKSCAKNIPDLNTPTSSSKTFKNKNKSSEQLELANTKSFHHEAVNPRLSPFVTLEDCLKNEMINIASIIPESDIKTELEDSVDSADVRVSNRLKTPKKVKSGIKYSTPIKTLPEDPAPVQSLKNSVKKTKSIKSLESSLNQSQGSLRSLRTRKNHVKAVPMDVNNSITTVINDQQMNYSEMQRIDGKDKEESTLSEVKLESSDGVDNVSKFLDKNKSTKTMKDASILLGVGANISNPNEKTTSMNLLPKLASDKISDAPLSSENDTNISENKELEDGFEKNAKKSKTKVKSSDPPKEDLSNFLDNKGASKSLGSLISKGCANDNNFDQDKDIVDYVNEGKTSKLSKERNSAKDKKNSENSNSEDVQVKGTRRRSTRSSSSSELTKTDQSSNKNVLDSKSKVKFIPSDSIKEGSELEDVKSISLSSLKSKMHFSMKNKTGTTTYSDFSETNVEKNKEKGKSVLQSESEITGDISKNKRSKSQENDFKPKIKSETEVKILPTNNEPCKDISQHVEVQNPSLEKNLVENFVQINETMSVRVEDINRNKTPILVEAEESTSDVKQNETNAKIDLKNNQKPFEVSPTVLANIDKTINESHHQSNKTLKENENDKSCKTVPKHIVNQDNINKASKCENQNKSITKLIKNQDMVNKPNLDQDELYEASKLDGNPGNSSKTTFKPSKNQDKYVETPVSSRTVDKTKITSLKHVENQGKIIKTPSLSKTQDKSNKLSKYIDDHDKPDKATPKYIEKHDKAITTSHKHVENQDKTIKKIPKHVEGEDISNKTTLKHVENQDKTNKTTPKHVENQDKTIKKTPKHVEDEDKSNKTTLKHVENQDKTNKKIPKHVENQDKTNKTTRKHVENQDKTNKKTPKHVEDEDKTNKTTSKHVEDEDKIIKTSSSCEALDKTPKNNEKQDTIPSKHVLNQDKIINATPTNVRNKNNETSKNHENSDKSNKKSPKNNDSKNGIYNMPKSTEVPSKLSKSTSKPCENQNNAVTTLKSDKTLDKKVSSKNNDKCQRSNECHSSPGEKKRKKSKERSPVSSKKLFESSKFDESLRIDEKDINSRKNKTHKEEDRNKHKNKESVSEENKSSEKEGNKSKEESDKSICEKRRSEKSKESSDKVDSSNSRKRILSSSLDVQSSNSKSRKAEFSKDENETNSETKDLKVGQNGDKISGVSKKIVDVDPSIKSVDFLTEDKAPKRKSTSDETEVSKKKPNVSNTEDSMIEVTIDSFNFSSSFEDSNNDSFHLIIDACNESLDVSLPGEEPTEKSNGTKSDQRNISNSFKESVFSPDYQRPGFGKQTSDTNIVFGSQSSKEQIIKKYNQVSAEDVQNIETSMEKNLDTIAEGSIQKTLNHPEMTIKKNIDEVSATCTQSMIDLKPVFNVHSNDRSSSNYFPNSKVQGVPQSEESIVKNDNTVSLNNQCNRTIFETLNEQTDVSKVVETNYLSNTKNSTKSIIGETTGYHHSYDNSNSSGSTIEYCTFPKAVPSSKIIPPHIESPNLVNSKADENFDQNSRCSSVATIRKTDEPQTRSVQKSPIKIGFYVRPVIRNQVKMYRYSPNLYQYFDKKSRKISRISKRNIITPMTDDSNTIEIQDNENNSHPPLDQVQESGDNATFEITRFNTLKENKKEKVVDNLDEIERLFYPYCPKLLKTNSCENSQCTSSHKFDTDISKLDYSQLDKLFSLSNNYVISEEAFNSIVTWLGNEGKRNKLLETSLYLSAMPREKRVEKYMISCWSAVINGYSKTGVDKISAAKNILQYILSHTPPVAGELMQDILIYMGLLSCKIEDIWPLVQILIKVDGVNFPIEFYELIMSSVNIRPVYITQDLQIALREFTELFLKLDLESIMKMKFYLIHNFAELLMNYKLYLYDIKLQKIMKQIKEMKRLNSMKKSESDQNSNFDSKSNNILQDFKNNKISTDTTSMSLNATFNFGKLNSKPSDTTLTLNPVPSSRSKSDLNEQTSIRINNDTKINSPPKESKIGKNYSTSQQSNKLYHRDPRKSGNKLQTRNERRFHSFRDKPSEVVRSKEPQVSDVKPRGDVMTPYDKRFRTRRDSNSELKFNPLCNINPWEVNTAASTINPQTFMDIKLIPSLLPRENELNQSLNIQTNDLNPKLMQCDVSLPLSQENDELPDYLNLPSSSQNYTGVNLSLSREREQHPDYLNWPNTSRNYAVDISNPRRNENISSDLNPPLSDTPKKGILKSTQNKVSFGSPKEVSSVRINPSTSKALSLPFPRGTPGFETEAPKSVTPELLIKPTVPVLESHQDAETVKINIIKLLRSRRLFDVFTYAVTWSHDKERIMRFSFLLLDAFNSIDVDEKYPVLRDFLQLLKDYVDTNEDEKDNINLFSVIGTIANSHMMNAIATGFWQTAMDVYMLLGICYYSDTLKERFNTEGPFGFSHLKVTMAVCEVLIKSQQFKDAVRIITENNLHLNRQEWLIEGKEEDVVVVRKLITVLLKSMSDCIENDEVNYSTFLKDIIESQNSLYQPINCISFVEELMAAFYDTNPANSNKWLITFYEYLRKYDCLEGLSPTTYRILLINFIKTHHWRLDDIYIKALREGIYSPIHFSDNTLNIRSDLSKEEMWFLINKFFEEKAKAIKSGQRYIKQNYFVQYVMPPVRDNPIDTSRRPKRLLSLPSTFEEAHLRLNFSLTACNPKICYEAIDALSGKVKLFSTQCDQFLAKKVNSMSKHFKS